MRIIRSIHASGRYKPLLHRILATQFPAWIAARLAPEYVSRAISSVRRSLWAMQAVTADDLQAPAIQAYMGTMQAKSARNHLSYLSRFCALLIALGELMANPCRSVMLRAVEQKPLVYLPDADIAKLLDLAEQRGCWPEIALALATGLRRGELIRLEWRHVDLADRRLTVERAKNRKPRYIPLCPLALTALDCQRRKLALFGQFAYVFPARRTHTGKRWYVNAPRHAAWWSRTMTSMGAQIPSLANLPPRIVGKAWHALRRTFASRLAQSGVSLYKIGQWLGHSDPRTTAIYAHLSTGYDPDIERPPALPGPERSEP